MNIRFGKEFLYETFFATIPTLLYRVSIEVAYDVEFKFKVADKEVAYKIEV